MVWTCPTQGADDGGAFALRDLELDIFEDEGDGSGEGWAEAASGFDRLVVGDFEKLV